jgi:DNA-binding transcriptional LysR family regulator
MDWDRLRIFHAVAEAGSFTRAGEDLSMSQSSVSRQVGALESELGVPLFHRHARGLVLTEEGELLAATAREIAGQLTSVETELMDTHERPSGSLRVTTTVGLGANWVTPRLGEFLENYPDIELELLLTDAELDLSLREADIAIRFHRPEHAHLVQRRLFTVHFHLYAAPEYLKRHGTPQGLDDLANHKLVTYGQAPPHLRAINWLETTCRERGLTRPVLRIDNLNGLKHAAASGIGVVLLPDYVIGTTPNLTRIPINARLPELDTYLTYPEEQRTSKRLMVFRDFLVAKARQWSF